MSLKEVLCSASFLLKLISENLVQTTLNESFIRREYISLKFQTKHLSRERGQYCSFIIVAPYGGLFKPKIQSRITELSLNLSV